MKRKIYDLVKELLTDYPELRDSDKELIWSVWIKLGYVKEDDYYQVALIDKSDFMKAPSTETIRRCRQKIQELHPELQSSKWIQEQRKKIEDQRGTHIYREEIDTGQNRIESRSEYNLKMQQQSLI